MYLELVIGPMYAGKTTHLINYYNSKKYCVCFKPKMDNRYVENLVVSHNKKSIPCVVTKNLLDKINKHYIKSFEHIIIDEGQFFPDLVETIEYLDKINYNGNVLVGGLSGDFKRKRIGNILDILPRADNVLVLKGRCNICKSNKSTFSWKNSFSGKQMEVGGSDIYQSVCGKCYEKLLNTIKENNIEIII
jgi:thymidine kinase